MELCPNRLLSFYKNGTSTRLTTQFTIVDWGNQKLHKSENF